MSDGTDNHAKSTFNFTYDFNVIAHAYQMWARSGFRNIPTFQQVQKDMKHAKTREP